MTWEVSITRSSPARVVLYAEFGGRGWIVRVEQLDGRPDVRRTMRAAIALAGKFRIPE